MGKKIGLSSPIGIALAVGGLILALSPQARSAMRRLVVKGTATALDTIEHVGGLTAGIVSKTSRGAERADMPSTELDTGTSIQPVTSLDNAPEQTAETEGTKE